MTSQQIEAGVELSEREVTFCEEYVKDWNASRSAKVAGWSEVSAGNTGKELLKRADIQTYLKYLRARTEEMAGISMLKNALVLKRLAYSKNTGVKDRIKAIEILNRMFGYNSPDKMEHSGTVNIPPITWVD